MKFLSKRNKKEPKFVTLPYGDKYDKLDLEIIIGGVVDRNGKLQFQVISHTLLSNDFYLKHVDNKILRKIKQAQLAITEEMIPDFRNLRKDIFKEVYFPFLDEP